MTFPFYSVIYRQFLPKVSTIKTFGVYVESGPELTKSLSFSTSLGTLIQSDVQNRMCGNFCRRSGWAAPHGDKFWLDPWYRTCLTVQDQVAVCTIQPHLPAWAGLLAATVPKKIKIKYKVDIARVSDLMLEPLFKQKSDTKQNLGK